MTKYTWTSNLHNVRTGLLLVKLSTVVLLESEKHPTPFHIYPQLVRDSSVV